MTELINNVFISNWKKVLLISKQTLQNIYKGGPGELGNVPQVSPPRLATAPPHSNRYKYKFDADVFFLEISIFNIAFFDTLSREDASDKNDNEFYDKNY